MFGIDVLVEPSPEAAIERLRASGYRIATTVVQGGVPHDQADLVGPVAVVVGSEAHGVSEAVIDAGAVRFRPMLLTAMAVVVGAAVILADPIFQGLAIALMAGEIASLLISRMAVPVLYYMANKHSHPQPKH